MASPVPELLGSWRERRDRTFLIDPAAGRELTYGTFVASAMAMAEALGACGIGRGDRVATLLPNGEALAALYFACLERGAWAMPLNPQLSPDELGFLLAQSRARVVVGAPATADRLDLVRGRHEVRELGLAALVRDEPARDEPWAPPGAAFAAVDPDAVWTVHFTSGTTSRPKAVVHTAGSLLGAAHAFNLANGIGREHRFYHVLPMSYMAGFLNLLLCPFVAGASVVLGGAWEPRTALAFWDEPRAHEVNSFWLVPAMLASLLALDRDPGAPAWCRDQVRTLCVGTAPLPAPVRERFGERYGIVPWESYGLSETLFLTANSPAAGSAPGSVGHRLAGVEIELRGEDGRVAGRDGEGEIHARAPWPMRGYLDYDSGEPEPLAPGAWFATGDVGRIDDQGGLWITGRKKDLIIRGGFNVSPRAVEDALLAHPDVAEVAVVGVPHPILGEDVVAVVVPRAGVGSGPDRLAREIQAWARGRLGAQALPSRVLVIDSLPRGTTGKVRKVELRELAARAQEPA